jgi:hypothetical protein
VGSGTPIWEGAAPHLHQLDPVCRVDLNAPILLRLDSYSDGLNALSHTGPTQEPEVMAALCNYNYNSPSRILASRRFATQIQSTTLGRKPRRRHPAARSYNTCKTSKRDTKMNSWTLGQQSLDLNDSTMSLDAASTTTSLDATSTTALEANWGKTLRVPKYNQDRQHLVDETMTSLSARLTKKLPCQYAMGNEPPKGRRRENASYRYEGHLKSKPLCSSPIQRRVYHTAAPEKFLGPVTQQFTTRSYNSTWSSKRRASSFLK